LFEADWKAETEGEKGDDATAIENRTLDLSIHYYKIENSDWGG